MMLFGEPIVTKGWSGADGWMEWQGWGNNSYQLRHLYGANMVFTDGHAAHFGEADIRGIQYYMYTTPVPYKNGWPFNLKTR